MAEKKLVDSKWMKVIVENRNPETEARSGFVGGNNVITNGEPSIRHFRFELGKEIELPESFVTQLKNRSHVVKDKKTGKLVRQPIFVVEKV